MRPLLQDMCLGDPTKRPSMKEVVTRFEEITKGLSSGKLRSRVVPKAEVLLLRALLFPGYWVK